MPSNFTLTNQLNIGFQVDFYHDTPTEKPNFQPIRQSKIQRERMQKQFNYQAIFINKNLSRWLSAVLFNNDESRQKNILLPKNVTLIFVPLGQKTAKENLK